MSLSSSSRRLFFFLDRNFRSNSFLLLDLPKTDKKPIDHAFFRQQIYPCTCLSILSTHDRHNGIVEMSRNLAVDHFRRIDRILSISLTPLHHHTYYHYANTPASFLARIFRGRTLASNPLIANTTHTFHETHRPQYHPRRIDIIRRRTSHGFPWSVLFAIDVRAFILSPISVLIFPIPVPYAVHVGAFGHLAV